MLSIVIAEDDRIIRTSIVSFINEHIDNCKVAAFFADGSELLDYIKTHNVDIVITDVCMSSMSGLDVCKYAYENNIRTAFIIISAYREFSYAKQAIDYHACSYMLKPIMPSELRSAIRQAEEYLAGLNDSAYEAKKNVHTESNTEVEQTDDRECVIMERALKYIQNNFNKDISLADVSAHVYLSEHYFGSIFKKNKSEGFVKYLNNLRIDEAKKLLQTGRYSVKEISVKVGFQNCNYFIKLFKSYTGITPKQYCLFNENTKSQSF